MYEYPTYLKLKLSYLKKTEKQSWLFLLVCLCLASKIIDVIRLILFLPNCVCHKCSYEHIFISHFSNNAIQSSMYKNGIETNAPTVIVKPKSFIGAPISSFKYKKR